MSLLEFAFNLIALIVGAMTVIICVAMITDNVKLERQNVKLKQQLFKEEYNYIRSRTLDIVKVKELSRYN